MDIEALISDPDLTSELRKLKRRRKVFSDIVDDQGFQYVDLVMEGGGMLGIALVGYTWALEQAGIRFLGIGGTSAGSINALLVAALGTPAQAKSPKLLDLLANKNFFDFVDGDGDARDFIKSWLKGSGKVKLTFKAIQVIDTLNEKWGLNPGKAFEHWIKEILTSESILSLADLEARMNTLPPGLREREGEALNTPAKAAIKLAIVAADVATETKVVFPENADLYFKRPEQVHPACFVRASMSIPYFFEPYKLGPVPRGEDSKKRWQKVGYFSDREKGGLPKHGLFVDGGVLSNFPINLFHDYSKVPSAPTFGVKLEYDNRHQDVSGPMSLFGAIFNSARHCMDYDFLHKNPEYKKLITWVPCKRADGSPYNWLDFQMPDADKVGLFKDGAIAALNFLKTFDWESYKEMRASMVSD